MTKYIFTRDLPPTTWRNGDTYNYYENGDDDVIVATWLALGYIEEVKEEEVKEEEWPKNEDEYYAVYEDFKGNTIITQDRFHSYDVIDMSRKKLGNCYRTEAEALEAKARVERAYKGI